MNSEIVVSRSVLGSLCILLSALPSRRRRQLIMLMGLMLAAAVAEVLSLGAILPFLAVLAEPQQGLQKPLMQPLIRGLGLEPGEDLRWFMTVLFAGAAVLAGVTRLLLIYATARINFGIGHELGGQLYRRALYQPYEVHTSRNSSEILAGIEKVDLVVHVLFSLLNLASAGLMAIFIIAGLLAVDPVVSMAALLGFGGIYAIVMLLARETLIDNSATLQRTVSGRMQTINEGLGGIRDVTLDHSQERFAKRFSIVDWDLRQAQVSNYILGSSPRFAVEALGMVFIAGLAYALTSRESVSSGLINAIPVLGALALGAQRLMPLLQQVYLGWSNVAGQKYVLQAVANLIADTKPNPVTQPIEPLAFRGSIRFHKVSFRYGPAGPDVLREIDLDIAKGQRIGLIGATGSGKSTAIDLLMGLLTPTSGEITVDGVRLNGQARLAWQDHIGHVSQSIYLADCSLAENIAFGLDAADVDQNRVRVAAQQAQIADYIEGLPSQYETRVGERGIRLSGGQRQRIGIARALYKSADVLVFDEATSALDNSTEQAIMDGIAGLSKDITVILVAHRVSTLSGCDVIIEFRNGRLLRTGSYRDIIAPEPASGVRRQITQAGIIA